MPARPRPHPEGRSTWPLTHARWLAVLLAALLSPACMPQDDPVLVFTAASLTDLASELAADFERRTGRRVEIHVAGSGVLARQVEAGAPADLLLSADPRSVARLVDRGRVAATDVQPFASNSLVVVVPRDVEPPGRVAAAGELASFARVAIGDPEVVPAGAHAREWLLSTRQWEALQARLVPMLDVRAALAAVRAGAVEAAVVYATDAATTAEVRVAHSVPGEHHSPITYVAAVPPGPRAAVARRLADELRGEAGRRLLARHGFTPSPRVTPGEDRGPTAGRVGG